MSPRAIVYCDVDCFYAQVEELRDPRLRGRPICVTRSSSSSPPTTPPCSASGSSRSTAKAAAGDRGELVFVDGSDLTPYAASDSCLDALREAVAHLARRPSRPAACPSSAAGSTSSSST